jgi:hypothetical protein
VSQHCFDSKNMGLRMAAINEEQDLTSLITSCDHVSVQVQCTAYGSNTYPGINLALVPSDELVDVIDHDSLQLSLVPDTADPVGELRVPDRSVSTDQLLVGARPVDQEVCCPKAEGSLAGLGSVPFHAVLGCNLAKVVLEDLGIGSFLEKAFVRGNTDVLLALCLESSINVALSTVLATTSNIKRGAW